MPRRELPTEIWAERIIPLLRCEPPKPLSMPARSALRQPHLATAMRVCRLFHELAAPLLYENVITDDLRSFTWLGGTAAKSRQLSLVKSLKIEYRSKGNLPTPTYFDLCRVGRQQTWQNVGRSANEAKNLVMKDCEAESEDILKWLSLIQSEGLGKVFPKLEKLSVGSIYGRDEAEAWYLYEDWHVARGTESVNGDCGRLFYDLLLSSGNLKHLCLRDLGGPLNTPPITYASKPKSRVPPNYPKHPNPKFTQCMHFDVSGRVDQISSPLGSPVSWVSDCPSGTDLGWIYTRLHQGVQELCQVRETFRPYGPWLDTANITIYGSTDQITPRIPYQHIGADVDMGPCVAEYGPEALNRQVLTDYEKRVTLRSMGEALQAEYRGQSRVKDIIRWLPSEDTKPCSACGSLPPVAREGEYVAGAGPRIVARSVET